MRTLVGHTLGHYHVVEQIGAGGMGVVYRAHDERLDRDVAIKVLPEDLAQDRDRLARFEREARAVARLSHPNILAVFELGAHEGIPFIVTELLEGESLREVITDGGLTIGKAVEYAEAIADGLAAAHDKGIIHRDLKPENVFITKDGHIKILDFGLAKLKLPEQDLTTETPTATLETKPGGLLGTVAYMAPEQVQGLPAEHRSDIFALGVVLYEMLTGRRPFGGSTTLETAAAILKEDADPISVVAPSVPPALASVVSDCLEKRPEDRFSSAHDLSLTLGAIDSETSAPKVEESAPRRRWPHILAMLIGAVIALLVILPPEALLDRLAGTPEGPPIRSIAVLPLVNISGDPGQEFFADGMTDALIADLAKIRELRVISRTSAMHYKGARKPLREIADELGVDAVVEGSVLKSGDRVRITTQLVQADPEQHLWAESYERDLRDILSLQGEVARTIAREIRIALSLEEETSLANARPVEPEAHEAYLRGRSHLFTGGPEDILRAIEYFQQAIELDPEFAQPYADLSVCYGLLGGVSGNLFPPREAWQKARTLALRAIDIDPSIAEGHVALGWVLSNYGWDWLGAEKELRKALELNPSLASARSLLAVLLSKMGLHQEALDEMRRAQALDPLNIEVAAGPGYILYVARRYDEAISRLQAVLALHPRLSIAHRCLGFVYSAKRMYDEAIREHQEAVALTGRHSTWDLALLGSACAQAGRRNDALEILQELEESSTRQYVPALARCVIQLSLDDKDEACFWLEKAFEERDSLLSYFKVEPGFDLLRDLPCAQDILRRMNFPEN